MANKIPTVIADLELQLASSISVGSTSFTLSSANDDDGNALPAGLYCFAIDGGTSQKEYLIGQVNGTDVTSVKSVSRQGVETTGAARAHRVGATCVLTNFAALQRVADVLRGLVDLDGSSPVSYDAEPTLADRKELATVGYVLDLVTGGTVAFETQTTTGTGGENIVAGDLIYFNTADQEWYKCDADTAATVEGVELGIALGTGSNGVAITGGVLLAGIRTTTSLTAGATYYASNTAGGIATSAGTIKKVIGVALSTTRLLFFRSTAQTPTTREKDAMAGGGILGTPSATNKFLTQGFGFTTLTAGETINGATLPVPVFQNKTDNEFYACDANDNTRYKFLGFAISDGTNGNPINVQFFGVVSGFTGLAEGEKYYVQDTVGTIGTTPGTQQILVGVAISETQLLIQKGTLRAIGSYNAVDSGASFATQDMVITLGFRPSKIKLVANTPDAYLVAVMPSTTISGYNSSDYSAALQGVSDTGFTVRFTQNTSGPVTVPFYWEAEGEL